MLRRGRRTLRGATWFLSGADFSAELPEVVGAARWLVFGSPEKSAFHFCTCHLICLCEVTLNWNFAVRLIRREALAESVLT